MTPDRWHQVERLFVRCLMMDDPGRQALLVRECAQDAELAATLQRMLAADAAGADVLQRVVGAAASRLPLPVEEWQGRMLGNYRIERQLGAGGMGTVFLARRADAEYERQVAIKVLSNAFASPDERRRFLAERQILADLAHPNIAQLLDGGTTAEGVPYLVMEFIDGQPIDTYCNARELPLAQRLRLFIEVCATVQYAHQHLVIHRDIKPGNILVTAGGVPKLLDFGIAKLLGAAALPRTIALTVGAARLLTPLHASPEQLRGDPVTTASDVYSLGVLLYRLVTGRHAHEERGDAGTLGQESAADPPPRPSRVARRWRRELAGDLDNIVARAMHQDVKRRYATAAGLAQDIECHLARRPVSAHADSLGYRLGKFIARHRAAAVTSVVAVAALGGLAIYYRNQPVDSRTVGFSHLALATLVEYPSQLARERAALARDRLALRRLLDDAYAALSVEPAQSLDTARLVLTLAQAYLALEERERASELAGQVLRVRAALLPADHADITEVRVLLESLQGAATAATP